METIDQLVHQAVFGDETSRPAARLEIYHQAIAVGIFPSSIHQLYIARAKGEIEKNFTVPAINVRGMTYDMAGAIFDAAKNMNVGAFIFELARSEMGYTYQPPAEYASVILAAAIKHGWQGPVFIQGDHFQAKAASMGQIKEGEMQAIKLLVDQAIRAGFYNIDIDMSTLVNLDETTEAAQQVPNIKYTTELLNHIREQEVKLGLNVPVSVGCEIGHIGGKNSTMADFEAFLSGLYSALPAGITGVSKMSIQTGTSHGGNIGPDGKPGEMPVDFELIKNVSMASREKYGFGGAVQHGASTLQDDMFHLFPSANALEIHLATGFQNLIFDHPDFPKELMMQMDAWIDQNLADEKQPGDSEDKSDYKLRKKTWGPFKKQLWEIDPAVKAKLMWAVEKEVSFLFDQLGVRDTKELVGRIVEPMKHEKSTRDFTNEVVAAKAVAGLSD